MAKESYCPTKLSSCIIHVLLHACSCKMYTRLGYSGTLNFLMVAASYVVRDNSLGAVIHIYWRNTK